MAAYINNDRNWMEDAIRRDFLAYEASEILNKVIAKEGIVDKRYWRFHPKGKYTISMGYKLGMQIKNEVSKRNLPGCSKKEEEWWSKLWSLKVLPKLKIYGWQVA